VTLKENLDSYRAGVVEEWREHDPMIAAGFESVFSLLTDDAVGDATANAQKVALDANRASVIDAYQQRTASLTQLSRKFGAGDQEAGLTAQVERDLIVADLMKSGPAAEFELNGEKFPAGSGAFTVQEIQENIAKLDRELDEQAILGWWGAGDMSAARADEWYKSDVSGLTQDRKDAVYGYMLGDVKEADYRVAKAQAEADRAKALQNDQAAADLQVNLARGAASYADLDKAREAGIVSPGQWAQLTLQQDRRIAELGKEQEKFAIVAEALQGNIRLDPKNTDHKDAVNADFQQRALVWSQGQERSNAEVTAFAVDYSLRVGIVPETFQSQVRGALTSGTDEQKIEAANAIETLRTANPGLLTASFDKTEIEQATMMASQARAGVPIENIAENVANSLRIDQATATARAAAFDLAYKPTPGRNKIQIAQGELKGTINTWAQQVVPGITNPEVPDVMASEYLSLVEDTYKRTGDMSTARQMAADSVRNVWGVSGVNGTAKWMKYAPETFYAAPSSAGLSQADNAAWMREELLANVKAGALVDPDNPITSDRLTIVPDVLNRRDASGRPLYVVQMMNSRGQIVPVRGPDGAPLGWFPDWDASAKKKALELETTQDFFNQQRRRKGLSYNPNDARGAPPKLERIGDEVGYLTGKTQGAQREFVPVDKSGAEGVAKYLNPPE
jgi:hypothetical protein